MFAHFLSVQFRVSSFRKISGILLFVVFAFMFASTNLFVHTHEGPNGRIVHSHPWSGKSHSHTDGQFQLIGNLAASTFTKAQDAFIPAFQSSGHILDATAIPEEPAGTLIPHLFGLKAPPCLICI